METYENEMKQKHGSLEYQENKLRIPILKYFWQAGPLSGSSKSSIHNFLNNIGVFNHFSDYEIRLFSQFLHMRFFTPGEVLFKEGDGSFGFYIIYDGNVDIFSKVNFEELNESNKTSIVTLSKYDYFGELSLIEANTRRNATCIAKDNVTLLAFFKPDLDELIEKYPVVAVKLLQAVSMIIAQRFNNAVSDIKMMRDKIERFEKNASNEIEK